MLGCALLDARFRFPRIPRLPADAGKNLLCVKMCWLHSKVLCAGCQVGFISLFRSLCVWSSYRAWRALCRFVSPPSLSFNRARLVLISQSDFRILAEFRTPRERSPCRFMTVFDVCLSLFADTALGQDLDSVSLSGRMQLSRLYTFYSDNPLLAATHSVINKWLPWEGTGKFKLLKRKENRRPAIKNHFEHSAVTQKEQHVKKKDDKL